MPLFGKSEFHNVQENEANQQEIIARENERINDPLEREDNVISHHLATDTEVVGNSYLTSKNFIGTFIGFAFCLTGGMCAFIVPAQILTYINADIGPDPNYALISITWQVASCVLGLIAGRLSDKLGRRHFVEFAVIFQTIGCIIAGTAKTIPVLIGANVFLGLASGVWILWLLLAGELLAHRLKAIMIPFVQVSLAPIAVAGIVGRAAVEQNSWRTTYWWCLGLNVVGGALLFFFYHPPRFVDLHGEKRTIVQELLRTDWIGLFIISAGLALFIVGISLGGSRYPWKSGMVLGLLITGAVLLITLGFWVYFNNVPVPIIPRSIFRTPAEGGILGVWSLLVLSSISGLAFLAPNIIWPLQVQLMLTNPGDSWLRVATITSMLGMGNYLGMITTTTLITLLKKTRFMTIFFMAWVTGFTGALGSIRPGQTTKAMALAFMAGFPVQYLENGSVIFTQMTAAEKDLGISVSIMEGARTFIGSIFTAVFVAILTNKAPPELEKTVVPAVLNAGLPASEIPAVFGALASPDPTALLQVPGVTPAIAGAIGAAVQDGYANVFKLVYYADLAVSLAALIFLAFFFPSYDQFITGHISRSLKDTNAHNVGGTVPGATPPLGEKGAVDAVDENKRVV